MWNVYGIRLQERELWHIIVKLRPEIVVLSETRADAKIAFKAIWMGAKVSQVIPKCNLHG